LTAGFLAGTARLEEELGLNRREDEDCALDWALPDWALLDLPAVEVDEVEDFFDLSWRFLKSTGSIRVACATKSS
jgi:hypothetical protein